MDHNMLIFIFIMLIITATLYCNQIIKRNYINWTKHVTFPKLDLIHLPTESASGG